MVRTSVRFLFDFSSTLIREYWNNRLIKPKFKQHLYDLCTALSRQPIFFCETVPVFTSQCELLQHIHDFMTSYDQIPTKRVRVKATHGNLWYGFWFVCKIIEYSFSIAPNVPTLWIHSRFALFWFRLFIGGVCEGVGDLCSVSKQPFFQRNLPFLGMITGASDVAMII